MGTDLCCRRDWSTEEQQLLPCLDVGTVGMRGVRLAYINNGPTCMVGASNQISYFLFFKLCQAWCCSVWDVGSLYSCNNTSIRTRVSFNKYLKWLWQVDSTAQQSLNSQAWLRVRHRVNAVQAHFNFFFAWYGVPSSLNMMRNADEYSVHPYSSLARQLVHVTIGDINLHHCASLYQIIWPMIRDA
jgi:hypothetical protein